jgi:uncharacterized protein (TIGR02466 family)
MHLNNYTVFPTIVSHLECDNFDLVKQDLLKWIYNFKENNPGPMVSNRGGWQSYNDFFKSDRSFDPFLKYIQHHIDLSLAFYNINYKIKELWININKPGDYNIMHHHHRLLSGVFWVSAPECSGDMLLQSPTSYEYEMFYRNIDPEVAEKQKYQSQMSFTPEEGTMLFFPSSMNHSVTPNESDGDRVSITFNLDEQ